MRGKIPPRGMHEIGNFYQFQNAVGQFSSHIVLAFIFITYSKGYLVIYILICTQISRSFHNYETVYIYISYRILLCNGNYKQYFLLFDFF